MIHMDMPVSSPFLIVYSYNCFFFSQRLVRVVVQVVETDCLTLDTTLCKSRMTSQWIRPPGETTLTKTRLTVGLFGGVEQTVNYFHPQRPHCSDLHFSLSREE